MGNSCIHNAMVLVSIYFSYFCAAFPLLLRPKAKGINTTCVSECLIYTLQYIEAMAIMAAFKNVLLSLNVYECLCCTHPRVVMVTMVYQKAAGME